ncbi:hypothetical protein LA6_006295 (plasmid) [Paracoccaceae bacterium]|nr:hypothetical protein LA6_006295 [Paracoccaceae bacterium]
MPSPGPAPRPDLCATGPQTCETFDKVVLTRTCRAMVKQEQARRLVEQTLADPLVVKFVVERACVD